LKTRLVLFDFDFTLVDASECLFSSLREGLQAIGVNSVADKQLKPLIGISLEEQFQLLSGRTIQDTKSFSTFKTVYIATRTAKEISGSYLLPDVTFALQSLQSKGLTLGIVSAGALNRIQQTLVQFGVASYFEKNIFAGASDKAMVILNAVEHLHFSLEETIYVGDRPDDGQAALRAGVGFVGVTTGAFVSNDFPKETIIITSLGQLPELLSHSHA
jgi:phosphoglycolate phosphatase